MTAERIATRLRAAGVTSQTLVGVGLDRSAAQLAAVLGVLKAGGAYVPVSPGLPRRRLAGLAAETGLRYVLTDAAHRDVFAGLAAHAELVDDDAVFAGPGSAGPVPAGPVRAGGAAGQRGPGAPPGPVGDRGGVACVMFTSGSTGRPKAVAVTHAGVLRLVRGGYADLSAERRLLYRAPLDFDAATFGIWGALLTGGTLVVRPPGQHAADDISRVVAEHQVDTLC